MDSTGEINKMKTILALVMALSLAGCAATRPAFLENRLVCTVAKDKAFAVSIWGPIGISGEIAKADTEVVCK